MTPADIRNLGERLVTYPLNIQDPSIGELLRALADLYEAASNYARCDQRDVGSNFYAGPNGLIAKLNRLQELKP